jgi:hypothetical protein
MPPWVSFQWKNEGNNLFFNWSLNWVCHFEEVHSCHGIKWSVFDIQERGIQSSTCTHALLNAGIKLAVNSTKDRWRVEVDTWYSLNCIPDRTGGDPILCTVLHSLYKLDAVASGTFYWTQDCHNWDNKKLKVYRLWLKVFVCWGKFKALCLGLKYESLGGKTRSRLCTGVHKCLSNSTNGIKHGFHFPALIHSIPAKKDWFTQCWNLLRMEKWKKCPS